MRSLHNLFKTYWLGRKKSFRIAFAVFDGVLKPVRKNIASFCVLQIHFIHLIFPIFSCSRVNVGLKCISPANHYFDLRSTFWDLSIFVIFNRISQSLNKVSNAFLFLFSELILAWFDRCCGCFWNTKQKLLSSTILPCRVYYWLHLANKSTYSWKIRLYNKEVFSRLTFA